VFLATAAALAVQAAGRNVSTRSNSGCSPAQRNRCRLIGVRDPAGHGGWVDPLECEHVDVESGASIQQTTTGLAAFQGNRLTFTDGWQHWALEPDGLVAWQGDAEPVH
jgi:hypothetical protein